MNRVFAWKKSGDRSRSSSVTLRLIFDKHMFSLTNMFINICYQILTYLITIYTRNKLLSPVFMHLYYMFNSN